MGEWGAFHFINLSAENAPANPRARSHRTLALLLQAANDHDGVSYEKAIPTATTDRVCAQSAACTDLQWESAPLSKDGERECSALTVCRPGQYVTKIGTAASDRECKDCDGQVEFSDTVNAPECTQQVKCQQNEKLVTLGHGTRDSE